MDDALVDRDAGTDGEDQDRDDEAPEIDLLPVPERKLFVGRLLRLLQAVEEEYLVAGVHRGMDAFG